MCGRFFLDINDREILNYYNIKDNSEGGGEKFPSHKAIVVKENETTYMKWGFPFDNKLVINARGETVFEKRFFKKSIKSQRCLIPACHFYEWKDKMKYKIKMDNEKFFSMAGVYNKFIDKSGEEYYAFAILTTEANREMSKIHHRMPVILRKKEEKIYLANETPEEVIREMLAPLEDNKLMIIEDKGIEQLSLF
ncbi:MAG: SOS response-associated peptidase [Clostridium argentinense]|uniref:Abasic site processing protein n=1 Tax=Clostridium faecium TaxID=2762223 RepID=A0ABR8YSP6_9CLOT|nr:MULTISPECIES: SOS response-associated peptidase [Clostridium]MBD8047280.1 SOS response-associated peptidase [Clostridium faecium]MBS5824554.1 SOS response-associated peptidase [Clostridium argentinense]MDU1349141.1 SOS response-associated peptidase [Clostridium argentinense]